jgi:hypothetical protein
LKDAGSEDVPFDRGGRALQRLRQMLRARDLEEPEIDERSPEETAEKAEKCEEDR